VENACAGIEVIMVQLENITWDMFQDFKELAVHESQNKYVASSVISLAEAYVHNSNQMCKAVVKAIYKDTDLIGYALIQYTPNGGDSFYDFHRFMIDQSYQGKGFGKIAFYAVMDYIKTMPMGNASKVIIEFMPENEAASHIYHSYGFIDTNEFNRFGEIKAELRLIE
jgi:diamine N-acetyltransferase